MKIIQVTDFISKEKDETHKYILDFSLYLNKNNLLNEILVMNMNINPYSAFLREIEQGNEKHQNHKFLLNELGFSKTKSFEYIFYQKHYSKYFYKYKKNKDGHYHYKFKSDNWILDINKGEIQFVKLPQKNSTLVLHFNTFHHLYKKAIWKNGKLRRTYYLDSSGNNTYWIINFLFWNIHFFRNANSNMRNFISLNPSKIKKQFLESNLKKDVILINSYRRFDAMIYKANRKVHKSFFWFHSHNKMTYDNFGTKNFHFKEYFESIKIAKNTNIDLLTFTSEQKNDIMSDFSLNSEKILILPKFYCNNDPKLLLRNFPKLDPTIGLAAGPGKGSKNIVRAIDSFKLYSDNNSKAKLLIWGFDKDSLDEINYIKLKTVEKKIKILHNEIRDNNFFNKIDILLMTSNYEDNGKLILETLVKGIPVVTSPFKYGPMDTIVNYVNGVISLDNSPQEISKAIKSTLSINHNKLNRYMKDFIKKTKQYEVEFIDLLTR